MSNNLASMTGTGTPPAQAQAIGGYTTDALVATGSIQGDAILLPSNNNYFATVAASTGAILPPNALPGDEIVVFNGGANALKVYPPTGAGIGTTGTNTAVSIAANKSATFVNISATRWGAIIGA